MRKAFVLLPLLAAAPSAAQVIEWKAAADGQWNIANNWNPANIPDVESETARLSVGGSYTVTLGNNPNPFVGGLELTHEGATVAIESGQNFRLEGTALLLNGMLLLNSDLGTGNAVFTFQQDTAIAGSGVIRMALGSDDVADAQIVAANGKTVTLGAKQKIDGAGQIRAPLVNLGTIEADAPGAMISLDTNDKTNSGLMWAVNFGELRIAPIAVNQTDSGVIEAHNAFVTIKNGDIIGGTIRSSNLGRIRNLPGVGRLVGVSSEADIQVDAGSTLLVTGGLPNRGTISVNLLGETGDAELKFEGDSELSGGPGLVELLPGSDDLDDAQLNVAGDAVLTIGPEQTIKGQGRMNGSFILNGRLEPGNPHVGTIRSGDISFGPTAGFTVTLASDDDADLLEVFGHAAVDGRLDIVPLYNPPPCQSWTIVTAFTLEGRFDQVIGPDYGDGRVWRAAYAEDRIDLRLSCYSDFSPDCALDLFDFLEFVNQFNKQTSDADCDRNEFWDLFDFLCFVNAFNAGC